jgi:hypothetical protein
LNRIARMRSRTNASYDAINLDRESANCGLNASARLADGARGLDESPAQAMTRQAAQDHWDMRSGVRSVRSRENLSNERGATDAETRIRQIPGAGTVRFKACARCASGENRADARFLSRLDRLAGIRRYAGTHSAVKKRRSGKGLNESRQSATRQLLKPSIWSPTPVGETDVHSITRHRTVKPVFAGLTMRVFSTAHIVRPGS